MGKAEITTIPYVRKVYYATYANLPVAGLRVGDLGYATDRLVFYRWSGAAWQSVTIHSSSGVAANIPVAADLPEGSIYYETDTLKTKQIQSGAWVEIVDNTPPTTRTIETGSYVGDDTPRQVTTGFKCSRVVIISSLNYEWSVVPSRTEFHRTASPYHDIKNEVSLHAEDGFSIGTGSLAANHDPEIYYWWAISE